MAKKYEKSTTKYANRHGTKGRVSDRPNEEKINKWVDYNWEVEIQSQTSDPVYMKDIHKHKNVLKQVWVPVNFIHTWVKI